LKVFYKLFTISHRSIAPQKLEVADKLRPNPYF
jgi:hypothetical protein